MKNFASFPIYALVSFAAASCSSAPEPAADEGPTDETAAELTSQPPPPPPPDDGCTIRHSCSNTASSWFASPRAETDAFELQLSQRLYGCATPRVYTDKASSSCGPTGQCAQRYSACTPSSALTALVGAYSTAMPYAHFNAKAHDSCLPYPPTGKVYVFWETLCSSPNCGSGCSPKSW